MYKYETHLHTAPASRCARASVAEHIAYYKSLGYAGIFVTNHFVDGNIGCDRTLPYAEQLDFYFSDYYEGVRLGREMGFTVLLGIEMSYGGTDFLIYGLPPSWYYDHPEIVGMKKSELLTLLAEAGALIVQAHPFREAAYIDHIRLFPRHVHAVEVYNACRSEHENRMARFYAEGYGLLPFAGSDNHSASALRTLGGMSADEPIEDEEAFVRAVKEGRMQPFTLAVDEA